MHLLLQSHHLFQDCQDFQENHLFQVIRCHQETHEIQKALVDQAVQVVQIRLEVHGDPDHLSVLETQVTQAVQPGQDHPTVPVLQDSHFGLCLQAVQQILMLLLLQLIPANQEYQLAQ